MEAQQEQQPAGTAAGPFGVAPLRSESIRRTSARSMPRPKSPPREASPVAGLATQPPIPRDWTNRALNVLQEGVAGGRGAAPTSGSRPATAQAATRLGSVGTKRRVHVGLGGSVTRPQSAAASMVIAGFISTPGDQYSQPPAVVMRNYSGFAEGQLQYQYGKLSPLTPTYLPHWVHDPPQRLNISDLRLQPSQRSPSCYSPEFISVNTHWTVDPTSGASPTIHATTSGTKPRPSSATTSPRARSPKRRGTHRPATPPDEAAPPPKGPPPVELSPPGQHRTLGRTLESFNKHKPDAHLELGQQQQQEPHSPQDPHSRGTAWPQHARPASPQRHQQQQQQAPPQRPASPGPPAAAAHWYKGGKRAGPERPLSSPPFIPSPGQATRWGGKTVAPVPPAVASQLRGGTVVSQQPYFHTIQKGLARSPLTEMVRTFARSSFDDAGKQQQSFIQRARKACALSRNMSSRAKEGGAAPVRHSHYPLPNEAVARAALPATHEPLRVGPVAVHK